MTHSQKKYQHITHANVPYLYTQFASQIAADMIDDLNSKAILSPI